MSRTNVVAVVVAYNRQELLRRCLDGLAGQTAPPTGLCFTFVRYDPEPDWR